jgi:hypothetical protein
MIEQGAALLARRGETRYQASLQRDSQIPGKKNAGD